MKAETERSLSGPLFVLSTQVAITKYYGLGNLNNRNIVFTVLEAENQEQGTRWLGSGKDS